MNGSPINIVHTYMLATPKERELGMVAYERYRERILEYVDTSVCGTERQYIGAFAALSPNNSEVTNFRDLGEIVNGIRHNLPPESVSITAYEPGKLRAWRLLMDESVHPLDVLGGWKVRNFYCNLEQPRNGFHCTIDGHAFNIWVGQRHNLKSRVVATGLAGFNKYERIADDYRLVAQWIGIRPNQLQATVWFTWKRLHRILWPQQYKLVF
jgi:hypothetical protein